MSSGKKLWQKSTYFLNDPRIWTLSTTHIGGSKGPLNWGGPLDDIILTKHMWHSVPQCCSKTVGTEHKQMHTLEIVMLPYEKKWSNRVWNNIKTTDQHIIVTFVHIIVCILTELNNLLRGSALIWLLIFCG